MWFDWEPRTLRGASRYRRVEVSQPLTWPDTNKTVVDVSLERTLVTSFEAHICARTLRNSDGNDSQFTESREGDRFQSGRSVVSGLCAAI